MTTNQQQVQEAQTKKNSKMMTVALLLVSVYMVIEIAKSGYTFGQWLHNALN